PEHFERLVQGGIAVLISLGGLLDDDFGSNPFALERAAIRHQVYPAREPYGHIDARQAEAAGIAARAAGALPYGCHVRQALHHLRETFAAAHAALAEQANHWLAIRVVGDRQDTVEYLAEGVVLLAAAEFAPGVNRLLATEETGNVPGKQLIAAVG